MIVQVVFFARRSASTEGKLAGISAIVQACLPRFRAASLLVASMLSCQPYRWNLQIINLLPHTYKRGFMMPNLDPRQLKRMMDSMGIKSTEIEAESVVIHGKERDIVIDNPQVTAIDAQGARSFQVSGSIREVEAERAKVEISAEDARLVSEQSGVNDEGRARKALEESHGDIAGAILKLKQEGKQ